MEAKKIFTMLAFAILLAEFFANISFAQTNETTTTTSAPGISLPQIPTSLKDVYNLFASINPFLLLIFGVVLLVMSHLGKYVAIVLIIFAIIQIFILIFH